MDTFQELVGSDAQTIAWWQMVCRGILVFLFALALVRLAGRRIFGSYTSFDIVLGVALGSTLSRAITGNAQFVPTLVTVAVLIALHRLVTELTRRNEALGRIVKGSEVLLIKDGQIQHDSLRKTSLTESDLMESLRLHGNVSVDRVKAAYLERSGAVSVVSR